LIDDCIPSRTRKQLSPPQPPRFITLGQQIHAKHAELSKADLYVLAGYVAIEVMGGPSIPFGIGRKDYTVFEAEEVHGATGCPFGDGKEGNPHGSRLPAADLGSDPGCPMKAGVAEREAATIKHIRATFTRLTMSDRETVALIVLGHQFGRCHLESSGFDGPWYAFDPTHWNVYENGLGYLSLYEMGLARGGLHETTTAKGNRQYELTIGWAQEKFMMLPADAALWWDPAFRKEIQRYDRNRLAFRHEASAAWKKLTELGCEGLLTTETTPARNP
jgi:catalase (peroxidase I)